MQWRWRCSVSIYPVLSSPYPSCLAGRPLTHRLLLVDRAYGYTVVQSTLNLVPSSARFGHLATSEAQKPFFPSVLLMYLSALCRESVVDARRSCVLTLALTLVPTAMTMSDPLTPSLRARCAHGLCRRNYPSLPCASHRRRRQTGRRRRAQALPRS